MDVFYFAFANDPDRPLEQIKREDAEINRILEPLAARGHFKIVRDSFATLDMVAEKLLLYKQSLVLFHFSGHAGPEALHLDGESARAKGIAEMLGACPRLQLVVLNGCATFSQVALLGENKVPAVIATHRPVEDAKASTFAIQFYRALSLRDPLNAAFDAARARVRAMDDQLDIPRGVFQFDGSQSKDCWGLFSSPGREDTLQWRLPVVSTNATSQFAPNELLLKNLLKALSPYREEIARIVRDEENDIDRNILDKRIAVLQALPHPVSELMRYLLTPNAAGSDMVFYDQPGLPRLRQMIVVYDTVMELLAFVMLAQLWDWAGGIETNKVPAETAKVIREFLVSTPETRARYDFPELIQTLGTAFDSTSMPYFVEELKKIGEIYSEGTPFYDACRFFVELKSRLKTIGENEAASLCVDAEIQLSAVLAQTGFLARYTIASVKNIDVLKYRHQPDPRFRHMIVKLEQRFVGLAEEPQLLDGILETASVLLQRANADGSSGFLNLTPFIIDENAFDDKATVAKLHFFERYAREPDAYAFRHIYMPGDPPLVISQQKNYRVVKAQFDAFAQLLFHQNMQDVV